MHMDSDPPSDVSALIPESQRNMLVAPVTLSQDGEDEETHVDPRTLSPDRRPRIREDSGTYLVVKKSSA